MRSKKAVFNIIANLFLQIFIFAYGFILPKIVIQKYGSNVNGLISSITQFLSYISLLESGVGPVVKSILYKPLSNHNKSEIEDILYSTEVFFKRIAYIFLVYILILFFVYPRIIVGDMNRFYISSLIVIIAISIFAEYFFGMVYSIFLQANQESYVISSIQIITYILAITFSLVISQFNISIHMFRLVLSLIFLLRPIIQWTYVKKKYDISLKNANKDYNLSNKWDGLAQHIAYVIHTNTDITILTIFSSLSEVSVYSVHMIVVKGIKALITSFTNGIDASFGDMISKHEMNNLRRKFEAYELFYFLMCAIFFSCTFALIIPFITLYTKNFNDANYIRPLFCILLVMSELIWAIRLPYLTIVYAAGRFKETRVGAWIECILNIFISVISVKYWGIIGVTIGTIVAMLFRTTEFVFYSNKNILNTNVFSSLKKILLMVCIILFNVICISSFLKFQYSSYFIWFLSALKVFIIYSFISFFIIILFYRNIVMVSIEFIKFSIFKRRS